MRRRLKMQIRRVSPVTGKETVLDIPVDPRDYLEWQGGKGPIQDLMPYLSDNDREFILSGILPEEWNQLFQDIEEEHAF